MKRLPINEFVASGALQINTVDVETHTLFIAKAVASKHLKEGDPMTFVQYSKLNDGKISERSPIPKLKYGDSIYIKHGNICKLTHE